MSCAPTGNSEANIQHLCMRAHNVKVDFPARCFHSLSLRGSREKHLRSEFGITFLMSLVTDRRTWIRIAQMRR
jgi:hypothetical protein